MTLQLRNLGGLYGLFGDRLVQSGLHLGEALLGAFILKQRLDAVLLRGVADRHEQRLEPVGMIAEGDGLQEDRS